jgi:hypothetical protein
LYRLKIGPDDGGRKREKKKLRKESIKKCDVTHFT